MTVLVILIVCGITAGLIRAVKKPHGDVRQERTTHRASRAEVKAARAERWEAVKVAQAEKHAASREAAGLPAERQGFTAAFRAGWNKETATSRVEDAHERTFGEPLA